MSTPFDDPDFEGDEAYFDRGNENRVFDSRLLRRPVGVLLFHKPILHTPHDSVTDAMRSMQAEHRGAVLITEDGTRGTRLQGIVTERDVLIRIVDRGRNPAILPLAEVMTPDPDRLRIDDSVARVLNKMSVGGFRHVPVVDEADRPVFLISVKDVVQFLVNAFPREILNLPAEDAPTHPRAREGA